MEKENRKREIRKERKEKKEKRENKLELVRGERIRVLYKKREEVEMMDCQIRNPSQRFFTISSGDIIFFL